MEPVYDAVITFAKGVFAVEGLRFTVTGAEHIPETGGAVIVMNHLSYMDFAYAGLTALPHKRHIRFMCKDSIFNHPVAGPLMRGMKHIPVDREAGSASFRAALAALKAGELVGVFPEATISRSFELKGFKSGAVRMAQVARVPIIPLVLWGSQRVWTKGHGKHLLRTNTPITLSVGEPITVDRRDDAERALALVRERMNELLHAAQDSYPALTGADRVYLPARLGGSAPTLEQANEMDRAEAEARRGRAQLAPPEGQAARDAGADTAGVVDPADPAASPR